jgi:sporulation protein YlmC with PRC-barrel domain
VSLYIGFHLLDRQIIDRDGLDIGKVDDVELAIDDAGNMTVVALLAGPVALGPRLGRWLGAVVTGIAIRWHPQPDPDPIRIPYDLVADVGPAITLSVRRELLVEPRLEVWLREHLIRRIPGNEADGG